jgi:hypothetical protein
MVFRIVYRLLSELWLGDGLEDNVMTYVDDVVVHSVCFEDHLQHLETVLETHHSKVHNKCQ